ncbi:hypothetical protein BDW22DRAFT_1363747 [Trametopsis cervina]|nr:hypothetical protein BDW22DRAFT_1363747 [Trametopsis cervina]
MDRWHDNARRADMDGRHGLTNMAGLSKGRRLHAAAQGAPHAEVWLCESQLALRLCEVQALVYYDSTLGPFSSPDAVRMTHNHDSPSLIAKRAGASNVVSLGMRRDETVEGEIIRKGEPSVHKKAGDQASLATSRTCDMQLPDRRHTSPPHKHVRNDVQTTGAASHIPHIWQDYAGTGTGRREVSGQFCHSFAYIAQLTIRTDGVKGHEDEHGVERRVGSIGSTVGMCTVH